MKNLFILLIGFSIFSTYSKSEYKHLKALGLSEDEALHLSCEDRKKALPYSHSSCNNQTHMHDGKAFSEYIRGNKSYVDHTTVTNNTNNDLYVEVRYQGAATFGLYGWSSDSYWNVYLEPNECVKIYRSNSGISPDFYDPAVVKLNIQRNNGSTRELTGYCFPCLDRSYTARDFWIGFYLSESDTANDFCGDSKDLQWILPLY